MSKSHKRTGSAYMLVIVVFLFVSVFSAIMMSNLGQTIFQTNAYAMQMQCYYMGNQAAKATVAALLEVQKDPDGGEQKTVIRSDYLNYKNQNKMEHKDKDGNVLGTSVITLYEKPYPYEGELKDWIVGYITTTMTDRRANRQGDDFTYESTVMILKDNPLIQLFNLIPEGFDSE